MFVLSHLVLVDLFPLVPRAEEQMTVPMDLSVSLLMPLFEVHGTIGQETHHGGQTGTGTHHDRRTCGIGRTAEGGFAYLNVDPVSPGEETGEIIRADSPDVDALLGVQVDDSHGDLHFCGVDFIRRRYGIQTGLEAGEYRQYFGEGHGLERRRSCIAVVVVVAVFSGHVPAVLLVLLQKIHDGGIPSQEFVHGIPRNLALPPRQYVMLEFVEFLREGVTEPQRIRVHGHGRRFRYVLPEEAGGRRRPRLGQPQSDVGLEYLGEGGGGREGKTRGIDVSVVLAFDPERSIQHSTEGRALASQFLREAPRESLHRLDRIERTDREVIPRHVRLSGGDVESDPTGGPTFEVAVLQQFVVDTTQDRFVLGPFECIDDAKFDMAGVALLGLFVLDVVLPLHTELERLVRVAQSRFDLRS
mmetsp:Transcript_21397/g.62516  ORF Transcript_21397/g.62516 Transcript_21397/m.62516 type:complete len:414 (+) Transcript_21397:3824-5065(+)